MKYSRKKLLIITDILPSKEMTAGAVLSIFHKEIENDFEIYYVNLVNKKLNYQLYDRVGSRSIYFYEKPFEDWQELFENNLFSKLLIFIGEILSSYDSLKISKQVLIVINRIQPDAVVFVIESQTSVRITRYLIPRIQSYKIGIFWDPIDWLLNSRNIDKITKKIIMIFYKYIIQKLDFLIVPSQNMKFYFRKMGAKSVIDLYSYNNQDK